MFLLARPLAGSIRPARPANGARLLHRRLGLQVLAYHSISSRPSILTDAAARRIEPADFERHLNYLLDHFEPLRLTDLVARLARAESVDRAFVITLDGGMADSLRTAGPILYRRRVPATVLVVTGVVGNTDLAWHHKLAWLEANGLGEAAAAALCRVGAGQRRDGEPLEAYFRRCFHVDVPRLLESVLRSAGTSGAELAGQLRPYLEPDEIASAEAELFEFGSLTNSHAVLSALSEPEQRREIETARDALRGWTGAFPLALGYPFGLRRHYTQQTARIAAECGHRVLLNSCSRANTPGQTPPHELSRKAVAAGSVFDLVALIDDKPANARPF